MFLRGFAQLKPLPSQLMGRTLTMRLDDFPCQRALQVKHAPRAVCTDVLRSQLEQEQVGHDCHGHGTLDAVDLFCDLMLAQADDPFQFFHQAFDPPPTQVDTDSLPRRHRLGQIGHQDLGLLRPSVTLTLTEDHRDVSEMAQPRPLGIALEGSTALAIDGEDANLPIPPTRPMRDEVLQRFAVGELPGAGQGHDVPIAPLLDCCEVVTSSIRSLGDHDDLLTPRWLLKRPQHLATQRIFGLVPRIVFASQQREVPGDTVHYGTRPMAPEGARSGS
jgi:hypothetical protein